MIEYPFIERLPYAFPFVEELMPLWHFTVVALGLCVGSFLNVCVWRMPRGESVVAPPSHCPKCDRLIRWYENIPVLSYLALRGRCAGCKLPISPRYMCVELLTAALFYLVWWRVTERHQPIPTLLPCLTLTGILIAAFFIDLKHYIIPDALTFTGMLSGLAFAFFFPQIWGIDLNGLAGRGLALSNAAAGMVAGGGVMAAFSIGGRLLLKQDALGWGDVKLIAAIGALFGLVPAAWFFTILVGSILGAVAGAVLLLTGRGKAENGKKVIPFGPCLAVAAYLWILYGPELSTAYFAWSRPALQRLLGL